MNNWSIVVLKVFARKLTETFNDSMAMISTILFFSINAMITYDFPSLWYFGFWNYYPNFFHFTVKELSDHRFPPIIRRFYLKELVQMIGD
jgi:hypothetical protein